MSETLALAVDYAFIFGAPAALGYAVAKVQGRLSHRRRRAAAATDVAPDLSTPFSQAEAAIAAARENRAREESHSVHGFATVVAPGAVFVQRDASWSSCEAAIVEFGGARFLVRHEGAGVPKLTCVPGCWVVYEWTLLEGEGNRVNDLAACAPHIERTRAQREKELGL